MAKISWWYIEKPWLSQSISKRLLSSYQLIFHIAIELEPKPDISYISRTPIRRLTYIDIVPNILFIIPYPNQGSLDGFGLLRPVAP